MKSPYIKKWAIWFVSSEITACVAVYDSRKRAKETLENLKSRDNYNKYFIRHCFMIVPKKGETK